MNNNYLSNPVSNASTITTATLANSEMKECVENEMMTDLQDDEHITSSHNVLEDLSSQVVIEETTSSISQIENTPLSWNAWLLQSFWKLFGYFRVC